MNSQFRYIFLQMISPFLAAGVILMLLLYLINIPRVLDVILVQGGAQSGSMNLLFALLLYILPKILAYILPVALLAAGLYVLYRLHVDNERVALEASGFAYWSIVWPMLLFALTVALIVLSIYAYFMPLGQRAFQSRVLEIHENITAAVLRPGQFNSVVSGVTAYVRSRDSDGVMRDILVQDSRDPADPISYLAASGQLLRTPEGLRLEMFDGSIHRFESPSEPASLNILRFDRYVYNLFDLSIKSQTQRLGSKERFLSQLFYPDVGDLYAQSRIDLFFAVGHNRLATPLFCFVYLLIALAAFRDPGPRYGGYLAPTVAAITLCLAVRLVYLGVTGMSEEQPFWVIFLYLIPLGTSLLAILVITYGVSRFRLTRAQEATIVP